MLKHQLHFFLLSITETEAETVTRLFCLTQPAGELLKMNHWLVDIGDEAAVVDGLLNGRSRGRPQSAVQRVLLHPPSRHPPHGTPLFLLVLMIQPLKVLLVPLIYSRQVNFVMFSFKTAI